MSTYRVDVRPILEEIGGSIDISDTFDLATIEVGDEVFTLIGPAAFSAVLTNAGAGLVATGSVTAHVLASCVRCLCDFETDIAGEIEGFYLRPDDVLAEDDEAETVDGEGAVDLAPALIAALVVEAPFAPLHDEECEGLCPECGTDLNTESCACHEAPAGEHPFAVLKGIPVAGDGPDTAE